MITNIYFVRHGRTTNKDNVFYGRLPRVSLSELGREQVKCSANYLKSKNITKIISSSLLRARQSAAIISETIGCDKVSRSNLVTEINSYMEGMPFKFGKASKFDHYFSPLRKPENETMTDIRDRMIRFVNSVVKKNKGKNVVAIAHGDPFMILMAELKGLPMELSSIRLGEGTYVKYGEIYLIQIENNNRTINSVFYPNI